MGREFNEEALTVLAKGSEKSFIHETKWCVITGAPCSGKTTVIDRLEARGFTCRPEIARVYVEEKLLEGLTLEQIRQDEAEFQRGLIDAKLRIEAQLDPAVPAFFDRAMPDSITYYRVAGLDPFDVVKDCFRFRYGAVLLFDPLPFEIDNVRTESQATVDFIDRWLEKDYRALGYEVQRIPVLPVEQRVERVLEEVRDLLR